MDNIMKEYGSRRRRQSDQELQRFVRRTGHEPQEVCCRCRRKLPLTAFPETLSGGWSLSKGCKECRKA